MSVIATLAWHFLDALWSNRGQNQIGGDAHVSTEILAGNFGTTPGQT